jgi:LmbE family N-acetylglucosaminyl deacetylase
MRLDTLAHVDLNRVAEEHVRDTGAQVVYTVQPDVNRDHRALFDSVAVATRPTPGQAARRVLTYAPTSSTEWTPAPANWFVPNWFVDVSETMTQKLQAFACFETEARPFPHPRNPEGLEAHARFFGATVGCRYAEPFVLVRSVEPLGRS